jgi:hypothetical protein
MGSEILSEALMSERRRSSVILLLITNQNYERCSCAATLALNFVRLRHVSVVLLLTTNQNYDSPPILVQRPRNPAHRGAK